MDELNPLKKGFTMTDNPTGMSRRSVNALRMGDDDPQMILHPDERTLYEWRGPGGTILRRSSVPAGITVFVVVADYDTPYDLYASTEGVDWRLIYEIRRQDDGTIEVNRPAGWQE